MATIELQKFLSPGVAGVHVGGKRELWVVAKARKKFRCALCEADGKVGHRAWRTTSNGLHRARRICTTCWEYRP